MTFTSLTFLIFLPLVFALYWGIPHRRSQNVVVLLASYLFYGWWDYRFCSLMLIASVVDYWVGRALQATDRQGWRNFWIGLSLVINLGMLGFFKYYNFFVDSLVQSLQSVGWHVHPFTIQVILPVGISFYTFQTLSYTIDVYRRELKATDSLVDFLAFVSFFPQLVAGPIERASNLLPQFERERRFDYDEAVEGLRQVLWGFFKKLVIADRLAPIVNAAFGDVSSCSGPDLVLATICFAFQIYCDFSAYSDIAVGTAKQFNIHLMRNFHYPYQAASVSEFWRRWHISLSTWLRDYLYIPLGGSRGTMAQGQAALLVTFLVSGLWHGASWHFVAWGLFHGLAMMFTRWWKLLREASSREPISSGATTRKLRQALAVGTTFVLVCFGWIFFRAETLSDAGVIISRIATQGIRPGRWVELAARIDAESGLQKSLILIGILVLLEWLARNFEHPLQITRLPVPLRWAAYTVLIWATLDLMPYTPSAEFIYFQF